MPDYDTAAIRKILSQAFDDDELVAFCFDHFPAVYQRFSPAMGFLVKIQHLLDYCRRFGQFEKLLQLMEQENPYQFEQHKPYVKSEPSHMTLALKVKGELSNLTDEQQEALASSWRSLLASLLDICAEEIEIANMRPGSILLDIRLPNEAAARLEMMIHQDVSWLEQLGLLEIRPTQPEAQAVVGDFTLDTLAPESDSETWTLLRAQINSILDTLTEQEQAVLTMRFGLTGGQVYTLEEVGRYFGLTRERIRQMEAKAFRKMRHPSRQKRLQDDSKSE
jgi:RNA polymerase sigma factor (sigma-70 family)